MEQELKLFFTNSLPFWDKIDNQQRELLLNSAASLSYKKGDSLHNGASDCNGLIILNKGAIRAYIFSPTGKEITIFRLFEGDVCILSASCVMKNINFDIYLDAEKDTSILLVPTSIYNKLNQNSIEIATFTNQIMSSRFSDLMWVMEQVLFMSFDKRLAIFLLDQAAIEGSDSLEITHETIARHMGSAREVVTRMLKYFQDEGLVSLARGKVNIEDRKGLLKLA